MIDRQCWSKMDSMEDTMKFNLQLQRISQQLTADDLDYLKFLCEWEIPESSRRMESVRSGMDLFNLLRDESKLSIDNLVFLTRILSSIRREHLLSKTLGFAAASQASSLSTTEPPLTAPQRFAAFLVKIGQCLLPNEMGELSFLFRGMLRLPDDWKPTPTQLFLELRKQSLLMETNTCRLRKALLEIGRSGLVSHLDGFLKDADQADAHIGRSQSEVPSLSPLASCTPAKCTQLQVEVQEKIHSLYEHFCTLTNNVESVLQNNNISLGVIKRRFRMLPHSIRRQHQHDQDYSAIRQRVLDSTTINQLFNNLTELKYWSHMTPDILTHIVQDVEKVHFDVAEYESRLLDFKVKTKLKDLVGLEFLLPDVYVELSVKAQGWQEKSMADADKAMHVLLIRAGYQDPKLGGLQSVRQGCIELTYVLLESIDAHALSNKELFDTYESYGILSICIDRVPVYSKELVSNTPFKGAEPNPAPESTETPGRHVQWYKTGSLTYAAQGGRDVLIIESDLPLSSPEVVPRRSADLTDSNKQKLKSQGISSDDLHEASIIRARYECDKRRTLFRVLNIEPDHQLRQQEVCESITELFMKTNNAGVIVYYIGSGRRFTGDWCFEDGFITFRDIAQLYLRASHNFKGRVLTIVSDCSYSGSWVRDCMEFLDDQGVQPCGHKSREKGTLIKVYASCGPTQIPTQYQFSVHGAANDKNTGQMFSYTSKQLLATQQTYSLNSTVIRCGNEDIELECMLRAGCTWKEWRRRERIELIVDESQGRPSWQYVLLDDDDEKEWEFKEKKAKGEPVDVAQYGRILESGWGKEPPNEAWHDIEKEFGISNN